MTAVGSETAGAGETGVTGSGRRGAALAMAASIAIGSVTGPFLKVVLRHLSPLSVAAGRVVISALAFVVVVVAQPRRRRRIEPGDRWRVIGSGVVGSAGFHVLYAFGQQRVSVAVAGVTIATMPVLAAAGEVLFLRHRLRRPAVIGLALALTGAALAAWGGSGGRPTSAVGVAAVAGATVAWAAVTVATRSVADRYDPWWLNTPGTVLGALVMVAVAAPRAHEWRGLTAGDGLRLVWLGAVSSAFVYAALARAMRDLSATTTASLWTLVTPLAIAVAWVGLGERPGAGAVVGSVLVVAGARATARSSR